MNDPALKPEVSLNKMESQIIPRLGRFDVVSNSFSSCISNTSKEFSWTPEMSFSEITPQPRMLSQNHESTITLKQLQSPTHTHSSWHLNKEMNVVNSDMNLINFETMLVSNLSNKKLAIHSNPIKLHGVSSILTFPHKVESILPEGMFSKFQIHFFPPKSTEEDKAHANFLFISGAQQSLSYTKNSKELNLEDGNSSLCLKAEVSLPLM